ncbi:DUF3800 domain-containing protein [Microbacterium sp. MEC084]|uniref:DUF3800 domain-containing protein n=1 Tax=Microbacterium sp. MEC084 TaxID=1963027 RepID=UPI00106F1859|nr:DUF3800 domain-containing protein [Microbacterium sp. MEC084]MCD1267820.1 DUF3800 domain-containing protein [Microbacterium sp. MEC084]
MPDALATCEVYCDESRPELFVGSHPNVGKSVIGSVWMPAEFRSTFKQDITALRARHDTWGEFKWNKVSPARLDFYRALVDYFFSTESLSFRAIVIDAGRLNHERFHQSDAELGFYKFYYQLLTHWIAPSTAYAIFCDDKVNRDRNRLQTLHTVLQNANRRSIVRSLQAVPSNQSTPVQLCDVLMGATQWRANGSTGSSTAKSTVVADVEARLGHRLGPTYVAERKFNIFEIRLQEGHE